ncbi:MAG: nucleoside deaminase [Anaerolineae bacterium]|nr:nucleoside deaminase [Anaerolineae bacterium]
MLDQVRTEALIRMAQEEAATALALGNPPFGAILTDLDGNVILSAHNTQYSDSDPTAHSEINALRTVGRLRGTIFFDDLVLFTNASPCSMCLSAAIKAHITRFYFGAPAEGHMDPWLPAEEVAARSSLKIELHGGILAEECRAQIAAARDVIRPLD